MFLSLLNQNLHTRASHAVLGHYKLTELWYRKAKAFWTGNTNTCDVQSFVAECLAIDTRCGKLFVGGMDRYDKAETSKSLQVLTIAAP